MVEAVRRACILLLLAPCACIEEHPGWISPTETGETTSVSSGDESNASMDSSTTDDTASSVSSTTTGDGDGDGDVEGSSGGDGDGDADESSGGDGDGDGDGHRIFITSGNWTGTFGSLAQADLHCQDFADQASLGGTWKALISDSTENAADRLSITGPIRNLMGQPIADTPTELWSSAVQNAVQYSEWGDPIETRAWTGTSVFGVHIASQSCDDWSPSGMGSMGAVGDPTAVNFGWVLVGIDGCQNSSRALYCVSQ